MVSLSASAKLYQERRLPEDQETRRRHGPQICQATNLVHDIPHRPSLDLQYQLSTQPDAGKTAIWPVNDLVRI